MKNKKFEKKVEANLRLVKTSKGQARFDFVRKPKQLAELVRVDLIDCLPDFLFDNKDVKCKLTITVSVTERK